MPLKNITKIKYPGLSVKRKTKTKTKKQFKNLKKREKCVITQSSLFVSMEL